MDIRVKNICKRYDGVPVLQGVSFVLSPSVTCLMAPSGWGKTTLLRLLLGLETPDGGSVEGLAGLRLSAVFQEPRLLEGVSAQENVNFVLPRERRGETTALLTALGLDGGDTKPVSTYSGGMRHRVALARALAVPFDFLLLDEPFAGLDGKSRRQAAACVTQYAAEKIVLLVTHAPEDAAALNAVILRL